jgi:hypothetical protein
MTTFIQTYAARETSPEIMEAIRYVAGDDANAVRLWEEPTDEELLAVWERVTGNGLRSATDYAWGASGSKWAGF